MYDSSQFVLFSAFCLAAVFCDFCFRRIFNWLILLGLAAQCVWLGVASPMSSVFAGTWPEAGLGLLLALVFLLPFYAFKAMGAGDVKFFAVVGFWLGAAPLLSVWLIGSLLAGVHGLVHFCHRNGVVGPWVALRLVPAQGLVSESPLLQRAVAWMAAVRGGRSGIPYAAYLAIAAWVVVQWR
ncbi:MAG: prepilin peptidase [Pigmentiphaga sp.]|uniref:A24 family peptidase n=1 Tax=Pigmentiphaga sp. TaxID=1977564 RepID=UPI0029A9A279|nr:prepilin peptidase [Pigmentiphaga sp.]MDX3907734.1 prepilin peptidase [Pigmentiphaga sp.]